MSQYVTGPGKGQELRGQVEDKMSQDVSGSGGGQKITGKVEDILSQDVAGSSGEQDVTVSNGGQELRGQVDDNMSQVAECCAKSSSCSWPGSRKYDDRDSGPVHELSAWAKLSPGKKEEKKLPDFGRLNYSDAISFKEKAGEAVVNTEELEKVGNLKGKIREEKKPPDEQGQNFGKLNRNDKIDVNKKLESAKAKIGKSGRSGKSDKAERESDLETKLEEKKPPDLDTLDYNDKFKIKFEGEQGQDCDRIGHNVKYDSQEQKEPKVLSKTGDMTTDFFKITAEMDVKKLREKKPLMFSENKIKGEMNVMKREEKKHRHLQSGRSGKSGTSELESELEPELEEKKPPDFDVLDYNDKIDVIKQLEPELEELKKPHVFGEYDSKVQKELKVLSRTGDMTTNVTKQLESAKAEMGKSCRSGKSDKAKLESELGPELEEKKPPDLDMLDYNDKINIS